MILTLVVDENVSLHNEANKGMLHASHDIQFSLWFSLFCVWWAARKNEGFINASQFTLISTINDWISMFFFLAHVLSCLRPLMSLNFLLKNNINHILKLDCMKYFCVEISSPSHVSAAFWFFGSIAY